jgi:integrase
LSHSITHKSLTVSDLGGDMASIIKHGKKWRALVNRKGARKSKIFPTRQEAKDWAAREEFTVLNAPAIAAETSFADVMGRYAREVSSTKRGFRWEDIRLKRISKDRIGKISIGDLTSTDLADWRDRRLTEVAPASVRREMQLLSSVLTQARREWRMIAINPMVDVRTPPAAPKRARLPFEAELEALAISAGDDLTNKTARVFHAFLFAIETGLRAGEIVNLTEENVFLSERYVHLPRTKNGTARDVPLSLEAVRLIEALPKSSRVFNLTSSNLDVLWRKLRDKAAVVDLTFHDSRHCAVTRLSKKLDVLALAKMIGHRDIKMLMVYYDESASELAKRLD